MLIHVNTSAYEHTHVHTQTHTYMHIHAHTNTHTHKHTQTQTHTHAHTNTHARACTHKHTTFQPSILFYTTETTATLPTSTASVMSTTDVVATSVTTIPTIPTDELTSEEPPTILIVVGVIVIIISMILIMVFISIICICVKFRKNKNSSNYIKPRKSGSLQHIKGMEMFESGPPVRQIRVDPMTVQEEGEGSYESGLTSEHCGPLLSQSVTPMSDRTVYMESPTLKGDRDSPSSVLTPPSSLPLDKKTRPVSPSQLAAGSRGIIPTSPHPHSVSPVSNSMLSSQSDVVSHPTLVSRPGNLNINNLSLKKSEKEEEDDVEELDESLFYGGLTGHAPYIKIN